MKKRILTGDRPTGNLHLGHLVGSLQNRVALQEEYDTFILIADVQALTTHFEQPEKITENVYAVALDNLSVGLNPEKASLFVQSMVPTIAELTVFYSMLVSVNTLRHNPTIKTEAANYGYEDMTYGFLGYPVSQTADITFCNANLVPVGEDQLPHMELTKKIVRRFNDLYKTNVLTEPEAMLSACPRLVGLDGNAKMGKSLNNAIFLCDTEEMVKAKILSAKTDPQRINVKDKGHPDVCSAFSYHKIFNPDECENICESCKQAQVGCVDCKNNLFKKVNALLKPIRQKREYYEAHPNLVREILVAGTEKANTIGQETVAKVKEAMKINHFGG
ncbi:MAG: tryptophan--tRNA ligase [Oscillospiraceae bacterium]|jgi:tryptophanyl-tRNA synthetase|nr:tryptophan--tRNA ligase [Oscillospiraceae bacterium]